MHDKHANLNFLFDLFDLDGSGEMERPEMKVLMRTLDKAAFKVGITPRPAREQEIEKLSEDMFRLADVVGCCTASTSSVGCSLCWCTALCRMGEETSVARNSWCGHVTT